MSDTTTNPPAGFYRDSENPNLERWFDGTAYTAVTRAAPSPIAPVANGNTYIAPVRQSRDRAQYIRQQKGHSLTLHILLCCVGVGFITIPYYTLSPNHYWHF